jgi:hypothetical protein
VAEQRQYAQSPATYAQLQTPSEGVYSIDDANHARLEGAFARGANPQQHPTRRFILAVGLELHALAARCSKAAEAQSQIERPC